MSVTKQSAAEAYHNMLYKPRSQKARYVMNSLPKLEEMDDKYCAYFCRTKNPMLVRIPTPKELCSNPALKVTDETYTEMFTLYAKITEPIPLEDPYACGIKTEDLRYYSTCPFAEPRTDPRTKVTPVTPDECRQFVKTKECQQGKLIEKFKGFFMTDKGFEVEFPKPVVSCFFVCWNELSFSSEHIHWSCSH